MTIHALPFLELAALSAQQLKISLTDLSQFIRLDQCERYLRLRLHERVEGQRFLYDYGVAPQSIPPILTRPGAAFEETIEHAISASANATWGSAAQG